MTFAKVLPLCALILVSGSGQVAAQAKKFQPGPGDAQITKKLTEAKTFAGETARVCAGQSAPGWVVQNVQTDFTACGGSFDNIWIILNLNGAKSGQTFSVCAGQSFPGGWVIQGTSTDFTRCGRNQSFNNIATIRKL